MNLKTKKKLEAISSTIDSKRIEQYVIKLAKIIKKPNFFNLDFKNSFDRTFNKYGLQYEELEGFLKNLKIDEIALESYFK